MNTLRIEQVLASLRDLPTLPSVVSELIATFGQAEVSIGALADKLSQDQALTAKTLRLANSSFYGMQCKVRSIEQAIAVLGFDSVRTLVTSAAVIGSLRVGPGEFDLAGFWRHSVATALCAKSLARIAACNGDVAFVSGLLHDIGRLVLVAGFPQQYGAVLAQRQATDCDWLEAERAVLGIDHAQVGCTLARHWKFPDEIQQAIAQHHAPAAAAAATIPSVVHVASAIVHALNLDDAEGELVPSIDQGAWDSLGLDGASLRQVLATTESDYENACQMLTAST